VLGDSESSPDQGRGEVVFTFDPDEAGQKAATKAFAEQSKFAAQTFVAVPPEGLDPCDVRLHRGDGALRQVIELRRPMYEFMIKRVLDGANLQTVEGRAHALRSSLAIVHTIRDNIVRQGYVRELAGWLGMDPADVQREYQRGPQKQPELLRTQPEAPAEQQAAPVYQLSSLQNDPVTLIERDALMVLLQQPVLVGQERAVKVLQADITHGALALVRDAMLSAFDSFDAPDWVAKVQAEVPESLHVFVQQLSVHPLPERAEQEGRFAKGVTATLLDKDLLRRKAQLLSSLQRAESGTEEYRSLQQQLVDIEATRRALKEEEA
jgi:DNA primase